MADFDGVDTPHKAVPLDTVERHLRSIAGEYLIVSDACRNFPYGWRGGTIGTPFAVGPGKQELPVGRPGPRGGRISAASPGGFAYITAPGEPRESIFTAELLDGLAGERHAKRWDPARQCYVVNMPQLLEYVRVAVTARLARYPEIDAEQAGKAIEMHSTDEPLMLREIPEEDVPNVRLSVALQPEAVAQADPMAKVQVDKLTYRSWRRPKPTTPPVVRFEVQPRCYSLAAKASSYRQKNPVTCQPYDDCRETVTLVPVGDQGRGPDEPSASPTPPDDTGDAIGGILAVMPADPVVPYQISSESGEIVWIGAGPGKYSLGGGYYRVRPLVGGTGSFGDHPADRFYAGSAISGPEWLVHVSLGAESSIRLPTARSLPSRLQPELLGLIGELGERSTERWSRWFGVQPSPPVPALLAYLAELLALQPGAVGLKGMSRPSYFLGSPVFVLIAVDGDDEEAVRDFTDRLEIRSARSGQGETSRELQLRQFTAAGLGLAGVRATPGTLTVRVGPADGDTIDVRVPVLVGRRTVLIWHIDRTGRLQTSVACPQPTQAPAAASDYGRRIELMQQLAALDMPEAVRRVAEPLTEGAAADPVASIICAAALSGPYTPTHGQVPWAAPLTTQPAFEIDQLTFLAALLDDRGDHGQARDLFQELGTRDDLPVTAAATRHLHAGLSRHLLAPERAAQLERTVANLMHTSCWAAVWTEAEADRGAPVPRGTWVAPFHAERTGAAIASS
jgi:hypothetical protein